MRYKFSVFPLGWAAAGLNYTATFFHEIGHTLAAWFYGYPTLPMFDFTHGGGMSVSFSDSNNTIVLACVWGLLAYGIYHFRTYKMLSATLALLLIFNLSTFSNHNLHISIIDFAGPGFEALIAGFFLFRAIFNLAPRGSFERVLNAIFGFGLIFRIFIDSYALLHNEAHRLLYYTQKGSHGFGDFDKIADRFYGLSFETVIYSWTALAFICLTLPFILFFFAKTKH
jgi:hypothetical protein